MRPGRAADHSPPFSAAVMKEWIYTSTHPLGHTGPVTGSLYLYLYIYIYTYTYVCVFCVCVFVCVCACGPGSSVGIATYYGLDGPESNPGGDGIFRPSRPALGPTQSPAKWVPGLPRG